MQIYCNKRKRLHKKSVPTGLVWDTNKATVDHYHTMAAMTSHYIIATEVVVSKYKRVMSQASIILLKLWDLLSLLERACLKLPPCQVVSLTCAPITPT